jgi:sugar phosphate isomerase/epimerase
MQRRVDERMDENSLSRREFLARTTAVAVTAGAFGPAALHAAAASANAPEQWQIAVFSKPLQWLPFADVGPVIAEAGFQAVDLTVRPGGHVLPERVQDDLPRAVETLRRSGLTVPMITTAITDASDPLTRRVLETARKVGVSHYRMGYWTYPTGADPLRAVRDLKPRAAALAALNREIGIRGGYQNHAGTRVGGSVWDIGLLLEGIEPEGLGVQYDICHATVEGGESWPLTLRLIAPHIDTIAVKDCDWARRPDGRWAVRDVPLGEGAVNFAAYLRQLRAIGPLPPMTMHFEYAPLEMAGGGGAKRRKETVDGMKRDRARFIEMLVASARSGGNASSSP